MLEGEAEMVADEADDRVPDLLQGQILVAGIRVALREVGLGGVRQAEIGAPPVVR
ncbi:hypothetical protein RB200_36070 [Streptomyces sp. PmtG]